MILCITKSPQLLSNIYRSNKEFEKSLVYFNKAVLFKDSLRTIKERKEIEKLKLNFDLNKKREELAYLNQKDKHQNTIYILITAGIVLLFVLIFRQLKIIRMTSEVRDVQKQLVFKELKDRIAKGSNRGAR